MSAPSRGDTDKDNLRNLHQVHQDCHGLRFRRNLYALCTSISKNLNFRWQLRLQKCKRFERHLNYTTGSRKYFWTSKNELRLDSHRKQHPGSRLRQRHKVLQTVSERQSCITSKKESSGMPDEWQHCPCYEAGAAMGSSANDSQGLAQVRSRWVVRSCSPSNVQELTEWAGSHTPKLQSIHLSWLPLESLVLLEIPSWSQELS